MKITLDANKEFVETMKELKRLHALKISRLAERYGQKGVEVLSGVTPYYTGLASSSWSYVIKQQGYTGFEVEFHNNDIEGGYNVIILIRYGHGVKGGGYVRGREFIDPVIQPIFDEMVEDLWREVCGE